MDVDLDKFTSVELAELTGKIRRTLHERADKAGKELAARLDSYKVNISTSRRGTECYFSAQSGDFSIMATLPITYHDKRPYDLYCRSRESDGCQSDVRFFSTYDREEAIDIITHADERLDALIKDFATGGHHVVRKGIDLTFPDNPFLTAQVCSDTPTRRQRRRMRGKFGLRFYMPHIPDIAEVGMTDEDDFNETKHEYYSTWITTRFDSVIPERISCIGRTWRQFGLLKVDPTGDHYLMRAGGVSPMGFLYHPGDTSVTVAGYQGWWDPKSPEFSVAIPPHWRPRRVVEYGTRLRTSAVLNIVDADVVRINKAIKRMETRICQP